MRSAETDKERNKDNDKKRRESKIEEKSIDENLIAGREFSEAESTFTDETDTDLTNETSSPPATGFAIRKSGLNFRQINPTLPEQQEIQQLKEKVQKESKELDLK